MKKNVDILLPCLNEEKTIVECIKRIKKIIKNDKNYNYQIVVCDNNSSDNSVKLSKKEKVKVLVEKNRGNGSTLLNGINNSKADYLFMLDSDLSYDEKDIPKLLKELNSYDLVIGNRFRGNIEKHSMPLSHFIGSRFLTEYANLLFRTPCHDFHSGLRAFKRKEILKCNLNSTGFEFASEMIIKAKLNNLKIKEIPTNLFVDGRDRPPHLKTIRDGYRHLHLINKIKYQSSSIFRYLTTFIFMISIMFLSLLLVSLIPQKVIYKNTVNSLDYFENYYKKNINYNKTYFKIEGIGDIRNISMAYNMNNKNPLDSIIRMSYQEDLDKISNLKETFINKKGKNINYSRYWQGQAMYSKIMLVFMPIKYTYIIQLIVILCLFVFLIIKLFKISKSLALSFIIMNIGINTFFTTFSVQYFFSILLSFIFSILVINMYKNNSKYIGLLFMISGVLTCFFDFLTCETLVLTLPLFIYVFLNIIDNKDINIKEIIKYIIIWGFFYILAFIIKWLIVGLYFGFDYLNIIVSKASIRIINNNMPIYLKIIKAILLSFGDIIPFSFIYDGMIYLLIIILVSLYFLIFDYKKYFKLLIICLIPFFRYIILSSHSYMFHYYTYRAFGTLLLFVSFIIIERVMNIKKN